MEKETSFWWWKKDRTFTLEEVADLLEHINEFKAGAIDAYLHKHVEKVFQAWLEEKGVINEKIQ
jgi:kynureninase